MADEMLPFDWPISNWPLIGQEFKMKNNRTGLNKMNKFDWLIFKLKFFFDVELNSFDVM